MPESVQTYELTDPAVLCDGWFSTVTGTARRLGVTEQMVRRNLDGANRGRVGVGTGYAVLLDPTDRGRLYLRLAAKGLI